MDNVVEDNLSNKPAVVVVFGGQSVEHEISCASARFILSTLLDADYDVRAIGISQSNVWYRQDCRVFVTNRRLQKKEIVPYGFYPQTANFLSYLGLSEDTSVVMLPILHGQKGEDGTIQGLFELSGIPYVGADVLGSALALDKIISKRLVQESGVRVVDNVAFAAHDWRTDRRRYLERIEGQLGLPVFVKPARTGSSVGIRRVGIKEALDSAITYALRYDSEVIVEKAVVGMELECSVIGDLEPRSAAVVGEITSLSGFYDYRTKYIDDSSVEIVVPARIDQPRVAEVREVAEQVFRILRLHGMARIDFFLEKDSGHLYFNEANTIPGFTDISLFPVLWQRCGVNAETLLTELLSFAQLRHARLNSSTSRDTDKTTSRVAHD